MKKSSVLLVFFFALFFRTSAQHWCGFDEVDARRDATSHAHYEKQLKQFLKNKPQNRGEEEVLTIPVAVHILHNNSTEEIGIGDNISDEQVFSAIDVLNDYFRRNHADTVNTPARFKSLAADIKIEFCLASQDPEGQITNGITRHRTSRAAYSLSNADERFVKSNGYWPSDQYMNIWVTRLTGNILGFSYFPDGTPLPGLNDQNRPELDGIMISPLVFGNNVGLASGEGNRYRFGKTLIHEVGHWLGLRHTFNSTGNTCDYTDYCDDTPKQIFPNENLEDCSATIFGECGEIVMHQNYMDYTKDVCMNLFTQDQKERMRAAMELSPRRRALRFSAGCCGSSFVSSIPSRIDFSDETVFLNNWQLSSVEGSTSEWSLDNDALVATTSITNDSLVLSSGAIDYESNKDLIIRLNISSSSADSIRFFYERACSGEFVLFKTETLSSVVKDIKLSLKGLTNDGLLKVYAVLYSNGNIFLIDDLQLYENNELDFVLFPNPTDRQTTLRLSLEEDEEIEVSLFTTTGKKVLLRALGRVNSGDFELDFTGLQKGLYLVKVSTPTSERVKKIVLN